MAKHFFENGVAKMDPVSSELSLGIINLLMAFAWKKIKPGQTIAEYQKIPFQRLLSNPGISTCPSKGFTINAKDYSAR